MAATNNGSNKLAPDDRAAHDWYRFMLSFPPHLVRAYLDRFELKAGQRAMDPFCGTGTTLVECKKQGIASVGIEANPIAHFATQVKIDWSPDPDGLVRHATAVAEAALAELAAAGITDDTLPLFQETGHDGQAALKTLPPDSAQLLLTNSISPRPLHKTLVLLEHIERQRDERFCRHERLALAKALVFSISNLEFGPEVGVGKVKADAAVVGPWLDTVNAMASDLRALRERGPVPAGAFHADARGMISSLASGSVDAVITSPPYPNEKDYTRTTRLEMVLLGFVHNRAELQSLKRGLIRSNTRSVYRSDDDDRWVEDNPEIQRVAAAIEARRIELGKTSGFERMYARVTKLYFGGMARHLADLRRVLRPGAQLAYVVGDQASYLRVMIRTGQILAEIAQSLGYELVGIDLFRTRLATATREQLREEAVVLRWPGASNMPV
jgi:DNA modification methylase